ncbi:MAG: peptidoglycan DD-metalloendopeptidase family protein [Oscillospiraceae bacterium]|nr:peptidoglycan DD-metalloendopeptidase family protein [Oscillospiraceae bacterium]
MYNDDFQDYPVDELEVIRQRRRQRELYHEEYGEEESSESLAQWWLPLLFKQFLAVAVLVGFAFALRAIAPEPFAALRDEYAQYMSVNMKWAEIFAQISKAAESVFVEANTVDRSDDVGARNGEDEAVLGNDEASGDDSAEYEPREDEDNATDDSELNGEQDISNNSEPDVGEELSDDSELDGAGGSNLPAPVGLSFAPLWVSGQAVMPVEGRISSPFGLRKHPKTGEMGWHGGVDIAAPEGTPILAMYGGTVEKTGYSATGGNYILLNHGGSFKSYYCHAREILGQTGEKITAGQTIAAVGSTGETTGPHLHLELRLNGLRYNPMGNTGVRIKNRGAN